MSFNPIAIILNQNKLTRPNYVDWKRNMDIVLTAEGYLVLKGTNIFELKKIQIFPLPMHIKRI